MDAKAKVVAPKTEHWLFTLCDEAGVPLCTKYLTFKPANPFGIPGEEFDESYSVKSLQLVPESMRAEARRTAEYWKAEHLAGNEKLSTLLTGLEAQAKRMYADAEDKDRHHEWKCCCDLYGGLLMTLHASTLASAGLEGKAE